MSNWNDIAELEQFITEIRYKIRVNKSKQCSTLRRILNRYLYVYSRGQKDDQTSLKEKEEEKEKEE